ncbi:MAG: acyl-CoA thioesterase [Deltaproteobacteria bacterium]|nr:acyl-CoA thioesterase [Deltaproteobacteria bacterium]
MDSIFKVRTSIGVRFSDVDSMGHVNNARFLTYFEEARVAYLKKITPLDFTNPHWKLSQSLIVASIKIDFLSPAYVGEELEVGIRASRLGNSSFDFDYEIESKSDLRPVAKGQSTQVYFDYQSSKSLKISEELRQAFAKIEGRDL